MYTLFIYFYNKKYILILFIIVIIIIYFICLYYCGPLDKKMLPTHNNSSFDR